MSRRRLTTTGQQVLLAGSVVVLFAVYSIGTMTREPYPAPIFPGFGSIPVEEELQPVRVRLLAFESGDQRETFTAAEAFDGPFDSFHPQMLDSLEAAEGTDPEFTEWVNELVVTKLGWRCADGLELVEVATDGSLPEKVLNRFDLPGCTR